VDLLNPDGGISVAIFNIVSNIQRLGDHAEDAAATPQQRGKGDQANCAPGIDDSVRDLLELRLAGGQILAQELGDLLDY
jgi:hypothetical protein